MSCPQCGTVPTPGGRFCGNCGLLLPYASITGAMPDAAATRARPAAVDRGDVRPGNPADSAPSLTLAVLACVVAFGLVFAAASAVVRDLAGESARTGATVETRNANAPRGAMGALLSGSGRSDAAGALNAPTGSPPTR